jgi:hypothetical protein
MKVSELTRRDLVKLRTSLILGLLVLALSGAAIYWLEGRTRAAQRKLEFAKARYSEALRKLQQTSNEESELQAKAALFQKLQARRAIGPEERLDWVELIASIRNRHRLFEIAYEISPQQTLGAPTGEYQLVSSTMDFRLPLLHEGDLEVFLDDIKREAPAIVEPRKCTIERLGEGSGANLRANCTLQWITLSPLNRPRATSRGNQP